MDSPLRSFIEVPRDSHFPIQNLPFGIFQLKEGKPRVGVAIGEFVLDLSVLEELGHFRSSEFQEPALSASRTGRHVFSEDSLNTFLALGRPAWRKAREVIQHLLSAETPTLRDDAKLRARVFHAQKDVVMKLPARIGNYTDLSRTRQFSCHQRHRRAATKRTDQATRCIRTGLRSEQELRLRIGNGVSNRAR